MKITTRILSIPPYLSTTWKNISSLHVREEKGGYTLIVLMQNRVQVEVPNLTKEAIDEIFEAHVRSAEEAPALKVPFDSPFSFSMPLKGEGDTMGSPLHHNPEQSNLPPMPPEVLKKLGLIVKAFGLEETLPQSEPNCNCVSCQVSRAFHGETEPPAEEITNDDLKFRDWDISQTGDKLYTVTNPLDANEHYTVFLGSPVGCTCGSKNCEHIRAVLNS